MIFSLPQKKSPWEGDFFADGNWVCVMSEELIVTSWWFQPFENISQHGNLPPDKGVNKK